MRITTVWIIASDGRDVEYTKFAVGIDVRSGLRQADFERAAAEMKKGNIRYEVLFLDASDETLLKRYKETRRTHPLQARAGGSLEKAIALERQQLSFIREKADYIIDTSKLLTRELRTDPDLCRGPELPESVYHGAVIRLQVRNSG